MSLSRTTNVDDIIKKLSPAQRKKVEARAAELIAEQMTLRELRHARKLTQVRMAKKLGITQDSVSRLEKRSDLLLSTLRKTVEAMGGNLSLVAEFPDREPVVLYGIAGDDPRPKPRSRRRVAKYKIWAARTSATPGRPPLPPARPPPHPGPARRSPPAPPPTRTPPRRLPAR